MFCVVKPVSYCGMVIDFLYLRRIMSSFNDHIFLRLSIAFYYVRCWFDNCFLACYYLAFFGHFFYGLSIAFYILDMC